MDQQELKTIGEMSVGTAANWQNRANMLLTEEEKGIQEGDLVRLESRRGELQATARLTEASKRGVLFMPWHFAESGPNLLTGPSAGPPSKMPELKFCAVRMEAVR